VTTREDRLELSALIHGLTSYTDRLAAFDDPLRFSDEKRATARLAIAGLVEARERLEDLMHQLSTGSVRVRRVTPPPESK
jgi:hypothetical protein